jgi:hypothetical protein
LHKTIYCLFAVLSASILIPAIGAQTPERLPKHGAEHEKLAYFLGKWVYEEDVKPTAYSRSGKYVYTESCEWFAGEFAIVCHSYNQNGTPRALSIMGYDLREKTYTYFQTHSNGESGFSRGTIEGDTWTWTDDSKITHGRFTEKTVNRTWPPTHTKWPAVPNPGPRLRKANKPAKSSRSVRPSEHLGRT